VIQDPVAHRFRQVEAPPVALEHVHHAKRLSVVPEAPAASLAKRRVESLLADVPERRVPEVVA